MKRLSNGAVGKTDIHAVAHRAHVSTATVSRVLNHVATVDPTMAKRVWKAISELEYTPNTQARALVSGKSRLFGLIVSEITNPFFPELIQEFERVAVEHGYEILIASTSHDVKKMKVCARRMLERKVDGVAVMTFGFEESVLDRFVDGKVPIVSIGLSSPGQRGIALSPNYRFGIHQGVQHLAVLGHRKIAFISGPLRLHSAHARKDAFIDCLRSVGLTPNPEWLVEGDHTLDGGRDAMKRMLQLSDLPTAIMCSNDVTAIGVQHALFEANLRVPDDFSLIGFDDIHLAEYTIPPLTTVRMSCTDLARGAVLSLLAKIESKKQEASNPVEIETHLIVRQTTGLPKHALNDLSAAR